MKIEGFHGYNVKFSPHSPFELGIVGGCNFGMTGNGHLFLLSMNGEKKLSVVRREAASGDVLTDLAFSPTNSRIFVTSSGNGKLVIHDINRQNKTEFIAHTAEISSVEWNVATEILTGSWDGSVRLWDINTKSSTYDTSNNLIMAFDAKRSPIELNWLATGDSSYNLNVWNTKTRTTCSELSLFHGCDVLTVNWHRLNTNLIFSGGSDGLIRLWDLRNHHQPVKRFLGHDQAVRKIVSCPFDANRFLSCSYDKTVRSWNMQHELKHDKLEQHTEFVYGLDLSPFEQFLAVDCSWDCEAKLFNYK